GFVQLDLFVASEPDSGGNARRLPVYSSATASGALPRFGDRKGDDVYETSWTYAGREWTAVCTPTEALKHADAQWYSWFVVLIGLAATAGGVFAVKRLTSDRYRIARELKQFWRMSAEML